MDYFKFGSRCYIKINEDKLGNFNTRTYEGIFLGYSSSKKTYRCYNKRLRRVVESIGVKVIEDMPEVEVQLEEEMDDIEVKEQYEDNLGKQEPRSSDSTKKNLPEITRQYSRKTPIKEKKNEENNQSKENNEEKN